MLRCKVTMKEAASVDALKHAKKLHFNGIKLNIEWRGDISDNRTDELSCIKESLETPPDQQSPHNILNALNDDCLRVIFEHERIAVEDLCTLTSTCQRFKCIADDVFQRKYADNYTSFMDVLNRQMPIWQWEDYLRTFGKSIKSIDLTKRWRNANTIFHLIDKYCPNIKDVTCKLDDYRCTIQLRRLFARLNTLSVVHFGRAPPIYWITSQDKRFPRRPAIRTVELRLAPVYQFQNAIDAHIYDAIRTIYQFNMNNKIENIDVANSVV